MFPPPGGCTRGAKALKDQHCQAEERAATLLSDFGQVLELVLDMPTARECVAATGQALVALEDKVEQLCASSPVGDYLFAMQLQVVRRERLAVDVAACQKELVSQKLTAQWVDEVKARHVKAIAERRTEDGKAFVVEVKYRGIPVAHTAPPLMMMLMTMLMTMAMTIMMMLATIFTMVSMTIVMIMLVMMMMMVEVMTMDMS